MQRTSVAFDLRAGSCGGTVVPAAAVSYPARTAHHRIKPMKHDLTLDHVKKEARDLLRGLQRRDPEAVPRQNATWL